MRQLMTIQRVTILASLGICVVPGRAWAQESMTLPVSPKLKEVAPDIADAVLTIDRAVELALKLSKDLAAARENLAQAQGSTGISRSALGIKTSAGVTATRQNQTQVVNLGDQSLVTQPQYGGQLTATVQVPIDLSGVLKAAVTQAQYQELSAQIDLKRVQNDIVFNVKNAFYGVLRNQSLLEVAQSDLQNAVDRLSDANLRVAAGTVAKYDVISAEADVATAQNALSQRKTNVSIALSALKSTIGLAFDERLKVSTTGAVATPKSASSTILLPSPTRLVDVVAVKPKEEQKTTIVSDPLQINESDFSSLLSEALKNRPEILREEASIAAAKRGIMLARQSLLPTTSLGYSHNYNPNPSGLGGQKQSGQITFSLNLPVTDGGQARARLQSANAQVSLAENNKRIQIDVVTLEVRQTILNIEQSQEQVVATSQAVIRAEEAFNLARLRYSAGVTRQAGVSPLIEFGEAQRSLAQAKADYVNALYDFNIYNTALDRALGKNASLRK